MWAKIITIKRTKDLNYFSLCAFNLFNTRVAQFDLNYWNKWTFPRHSNLLRCTCNLWKCSIWLPLSKYRSLFTNDLLFAADTGLYLIWILLVLSSAFDTVDHNVLINYLKTCVGISDVALDWFISLFIEQVLVSSAWRCRLLSCFSILWGPSRIYFGSPFVSYLQTRFPKSWDTVQIVNKNRMQWCGRFKFQYFIRNTT